MGTIRGTLASLTRSLDQVDTTTHELELAEMHLHLALGLGLGFAALVFAIFAMQLAFASTLHILVVFI